MKNSVINTVNEFHEMVRKHWDAHYIYRGEDSDKYELRPKFGRDQKISPKNSQQVEKDIFEEFKRQSIPYLPYAPQDDWDWLSIAQHHGLHTRLLDWTANPLTAAYFSVNFKWIGDSVIYIFNTDDLPKVNEKNSPSPFDMTDSMLLFPRSMTPRISAQSARFTVHSKPKDIFDVPSLERVLIKKECKMELMAVLDTYNVNVFTLFPDLDGLARHLIQDWIHY